ncbi:MAG TPA: toll/interleukin-1 receptor domain-containing protein [Thermoanaerobaculia bacterium]|nr:toll/interleukin-1 receptor domain-containing protein [Thermoanaerobaculia bacterium]
MHDVFISYSHKDKEWVDGVLVRTLTAHGIDVLIDSDDFAGGATSIENMTSAVENAQRTVVVLTDAWVQSEWTRFEGLLSVQTDPTGSKGKLIPILRQKCEPPKWLSIRSYLDFLDDTRIAQQMERLIRALKRTPAASDAAVKIDVVNEGLRTVADLIASGPARDALLEFRFRFESISGRIDRLASFKEVHDQLHHIQLHCHDPIVRDLPRLADDDLAVDAMLQYSDTLQQSIDRLKQLNNSDVFDNFKLTWIATLDRALQSLGQGIEARDGAVVKRAAALLDRVLASEPPRIDARLSDAASELELDAVIDAVALVCRKAKEANLDAAKLTKLEHALDEMECLDDTLEELVRSHAAWQDVDVAMRRVDTNLEADSFELIDAWPELKKQVALLTAATAEWAKSLGKEADSLDQAIAENDANKMARHFRRYRQRAVTRFFAVDSNLNQQCVELRKAGDPLAAIVQALA